MSWLEDAASVRSLFPGFQHATNVTLTFLLLLNPRELEWETDDRRHVNDEFCECMRACG